MDHQIEQNRLTRTLRYTLKTDRFSSHSQIADWLKRYKAQVMPDRLCIVYDIGCAQGMLGQLLEPGDFVLYGVDSEIAAVEQARLTYRDVIHADIESGSIFAFPEPPDVLVLADVLEHTRDPWQRLDHLCQTYLSPGTRVVISLPNIAHLYLRLSLLAGRFEYTERGLTDRTHLRFFTLTSALRLVQQCNIVVGPCGRCIGSRPYWLKFSKPC
jgi:2-polyprenyl-3-methyl-5-hydroxy-6-metoxy-1,4-benzoquinol methylase